MARSTKSKVEKVEEVVKETRKNAPRKRPEIDKNESIPCRSVVEGSLTYLSKKSGMRVVWRNYGDEEYIDFEELLTMKASNDRFLTEPWIIIENEDVVEYFGLRKLYGEIIDVDSLEELFELPLEEILEKLKRQPKGFRETIAQRARIMVESGDLYDRRVIKLLEGELKIDLSLITN